MTKAWILVGMMGVGKSSLGSLLAEKTGREFIDTDRLLQHRLGRPIPQIFSIYGELAFRDHETSILRGLEPGESVIATGGGIVMREQNWEEIERLGHSIYLKVPTDVLVARLELSKKKRPLLEVDGWQERVVTLIEERTPMYERASIHVELADLELEAASEIVLAALRRAGAW